jgi:Ca2+-binding EF-hand superfamily protein
VYGFFVTDAHSLFHALDRDSSGAIDRDELIRGLKRMGVHASMKAMNQWVDHLDMNDDGKFWVGVGAGGSIDVNTVPGF